MVAPVHNFDPKTLLEGSAKLRWVGRGAGGLLFQSLCGPVERKALDVGGLSSSLKKSIYFLESPSPWRPSLIDFIYFWGSIEAAMGGRTLSTPLGVAMSTKRRVRAAHKPAHVAKTH